MKMLIWTKLVNKYREWTMCIINHENDVVFEVERLFGTNGEYTEEVKKLMTKYNITNPIMVSNIQSADVYGSNMSSKDAVKKYIEDTDRDKRISEFLTPEKCEEIMNAFKKK